MGIRPYALGDLLAESQLGLELLTGGPDALLTPLVGAHAIELEQPTKWLDVNWMMLTMGGRLRNKPYLQRQIVAELQDLGATCLGFGVGLSFKSVPPALLDEARKRNFPVVLVPERTHFRDITRAVFNAAVSNESTTFHRLSSIQKDLFRAFGDDHPLESIIQRLGRSIHSTVAVMSLDGHLDAATGALPIADVAARLVDHANFPFAQFDAAGQHVLAAPVGVSCGPSARWLVVTSSRTRVVHQLARAAVQVTAPLVDVLLRMSAANQRQERAVREALLDSALDDRLKSTDTGSLSARMSAFGVDFVGGFRVAVVHARAGAFTHWARGADLDEEVATFLHARLSASGARYLLSRRGPEIVVVGSGSTLESVAADLLNEWNTLTVGIGRSLTSAADIGTSHRDAKIAVEHLGVQPDRSVMSFGELDLVTQLLAEVPVERFDATVGPIVTLLQENPIQLEALRAYFANNRDVKAAADSIFLHPNTLRYRLERLEQALGRSLREPSVTASLYCVLTLMADFITARSASAEQAPEMRSSGGNPPSGAVASLAAG